MSSNTVDAINIEPLDTVLLHEMSSHSFREAVFSIFQPNGLLFMMLTR